MTRLAFLLPPALLPLALLAACAPTLAPDSGRAVIRHPAGWQSVATDADRARLAGWRRSFTTALARARAAGHGAAIDAEGALLLPDAAIPGPPIPNGLYACRVTKLGAKSAGLLDYVAYPAFRCRVQVEKAYQGFAKLTGSQRQVGLVFPADGLRQVFLGTLELGDEARPMLYGRDPQRDVAGWVEKIGANRWRMVMPAPAYESLTDVMELVPLR